MLTILFGAGFTVAFCCALGYLLLARLRLALYWQEALFIGFLSGAACLSLLVFVLCLFHQARPPVFLPLGSAAIATAIGMGWRQPRGKSLPLPSRLSLAIFILVFTAFFIVYCMNAMAPEVSPDGSGYHLGNVARTLRAHGFDWDYRSMYSYISQGAELLFLVGFAIGGHSSSALIHFAFLVTLPLLVASYGLRFGFPAAGLFAAILTFTSPVVGLDGSSAYNDVALVTVLFAVFYLLQVFNETNDSKLLILIGLLSGFSYSIKYTAFLCVPFAVTLLWRKASLPTLFRWLVPPVALLTLPWLIRNWIWVANPFAPFLNRWFPNPFFYPGVEKQYLADLGRYEGLHHWWEIPIHLTVRGGLVPGILGPAFLLAPLALLALANPHGRKLLLAAAVFCLPALFNTGARFLIPGIPFVSLAMGIALSQSWGTIPALALFEAVVCWPGILSLYCDPWAWRIRNIPVQAALRQQPESQFLAAHLPDYALKPAIEAATSPADKIFSFDNRPMAYIDRDILVGYESALGNLAQDALWTPAVLPPATTQRFRFAPLFASVIRLRQTRSLEADWTLSEVRLSAQGRELRPASPWRITAHPNPWQAALAFDGNLATRWSTGQAMMAGDYLQVELPEPQAIDEVSFQNSSSTRGSIQLEVRIPGGTWQPLNATPEDVQDPPPPDLRLQATRELKALGIRYLLISDTDFTAADMKQHSNLWGITDLAEANGTHFYRID